MTATDLEALLRIAEDGNEEAADRLAEIAAEHHDVETLIRLVDEGSETARSLLSRVIGETE